MCVCVASSMDRSTIPPSPDPPAAAPVAAAARRSVEVGSVRREPEVYVHRSAVSVHGDAFVLGVVLVGPQKAQPVLAKHLTPTHKATN